MGLFVYSFLKLFSVLKNKENKEKNIWFLVFFIFFCSKNTKNTQLKEQEEFPLNIILAFSMFSKTETKQTI